MLKVYYSYSEESKIYMVVVPSYMFIGVGESIAMALCGMQTTQYRYAADKLVICNEKYPAIITGNYALTGSQVELDKISFQELNKIIVNMGYHNE